MLERKLQPVGVVFLEDSYEVLNMLSSWVNIGEAAIFGESPPLVHPWGMDSCSGERFGVGTVCVVNDYIRTSGVYFRPCPSTIFVT